MITITIGSSENVANIPTNAQALISAERINLSAETKAHRTSVGVVVSANAQSVTLATRPIALEKAQKTQRLNQSLKMGFAPPLKSTSSK